MKIIKTISFLIISLLITSFLDVKSISYDANTYDKVLARIDRLKNQKQRHDAPEEAGCNEVYQKSVLEFAHEKFPNLNGLWLLSKTTTKRKINPVLSKEVVFKHCNSRLPFEKRDFKEKEVIISSNGPDYFRINARYPLTTDTYYDPNQNIEIKYLNFGLKGVIDPDDITYAYTVKTDKHLENPAVARQLWLNGRLYFESISDRKVIAKGYEVEYTPECLGYVVDEIVFELNKIRDFSGASQGTFAELPLFELPAHAAPSGVLPEEKEIKGEKNYFKYIKEFDTAKDRSRFIPSPKYEPVDTTVLKPIESFDNESEKLKHKKEYKFKVPGMW